MWLRRRRWGNEGLWRWVEGRKLFLFGGSTHVEGDVVGIDQLWRGSDRLVVDGGIGQDGIEAEATDIVIIALVDDLAGRQRQWLDIVEHVA
ncbi:hypothetical protein D3C72_2186560 [compost metagenome]